MSAAELLGLADRLRSLPGLQAKRDIQAAAAAFENHPFAEQGAASRLGDDAALIPAQTGRLLLACEGMQPELVQEDPWFAGWSAVLVNVSDIAAMGGRGLALVNSVWSPDEPLLGRLLEGMRRACDTFALPMVGGHTNAHSPYAALAVAVLGVADGPVLSAREAQAGDALVLLVNGEGQRYRHYPFWDAATSADPACLREHLALLPRLAASGIARAAKDISMGGLVGTAAMFAEACGLEISLDLERIPRPPGLEELEWLSCFPSFGFLLAVPPAQLPRLDELLRPYGQLIHAVIGGFAAGAGGVKLQRQGQSQPLWDPQAPLTGFAAVASP
ncbi:MAG: sll0787 family AIR synthase-like protein [Synechococcaceae cyanobacterium]|jgi:AIR synthase-related protein